MKPLILIISLVLTTLKAWPQTPTPITISWTKKLKGDFSFKQNWSYPLGVEKKADGKAGCENGGFCPPECYDMLDSNGIVHQNLAQQFYQCLDTSHQFHTLECQATCYEWGGTDFIEVHRQNKDSVFCHSLANIATHCTLELEINQTICKASLFFASITHHGNKTYYCNKGYIKIDQKLWQQGIMKAKFHFNFPNPDDPQNPFYWKGKIYAKIKTS